MLLSCLKVLRVTNHLRKLSTDANSCLSVDTYNDVRLISINRPLKRNSLNSETLYRLKDALVEFDNDNSCAVCVIHGEGGIFCSGFDIDQIIEEGYKSLLKASESFKQDPICKKPLIAAVDGFAVAEGFELMLACDLRVIEDTASLGFLGRRYGAPTLLGGTERLTNLVGASRALSLLCSGLQINGELANTWGLAARLVSTGTCVGQAINLAIAIAKYPQNGVIHDKLKVYEYLQRHNQQHINQNKDHIEIFRKESIKDVEKNAAKFKEGIGKHGKFKNIKIIEPPDWEKDDDALEKA